MKQLKDLHQFCINILHWFKIFAWSCKICIIPRKICTNHEQIIDKNTVDQEQILVELLEEAWTFSPCDINNYNLLLALTELSHLFYFTSYFLCTKLEGSMILQVPGYKCLSSRLDISIQDRSHCTSVSVTSCLVAGSSTAGKSSLETGQRLRVQNVQRP